MNLDQQPEITRTRMTLTLEAATLLMAIVLAAGCLVWSVVMVRQSERRADQDRTDRIAAEGERDAARVASIEAGRQSRCEKAQGANFALILFGILDATSGLEEARLQGLSTEPFVEKLAAARAPLVAAVKDGKLQMQECTD